MNFAFLLLCFICFKTAQRHKSRILTMLHLESGEGFAALPSQYFSSPENLELLSLPPCLAPQGFAIAREVSESRASLFCLCWAH